MARVSGKTTLLQGEEEEVEDEGEEEEGEGEGEGKGDGEGKKTNLLLGWGEQLRPDSGLADPAADLLRAKRQQQKAVSSGAIEARLAVPTEGRAGERALGHLAVDLPEAEVGEAQIVGHVRV